VAIPAERVLQVSITAIHSHGWPHGDLEQFRTDDCHLQGDCSAMLLPFGGGERACLGKSLAELEIHLLAVGSAEAAAPGAGTRSGPHAEGHAEPCAEGWVVGQRG